MVNKNTRETIIAILVLMMAFLTGYFAGHTGGYSRGLSEGVEMGKGDKWDCAYSYSTGFLMCYRTPKYK